MGGLANEPANDSQFHDEMDGASIQPCAECGSTLRVRRGWQGADCTAKRKIPKTLMAISAPVLTVLISPRSTARAA